MTLIKGIVTDKEDSSGLPQANVWLSDSQGKKITPLIGVASDIEGNYTLDTTQNPQATHITASYMGYGKTIAPIPKNSTTLDLPLSESDTLLKEFEIVYDKSKEEEDEKKKKLKKALIVGGISLVVIVATIIIIKKIK